MRGLGGTGERVLVMVDGIPINDPYYRYINWDKIPKENIERIEVIRGGGATTLWGNLAMGGVINIVTRIPKPDEHRYSFGYGSYNTLRATADDTLYSTPTLTVASNLSRAQSSGYDLTPEQFQSSHMGSVSSYSDDAEVNAFLNPDPDSNYFFKIGLHQLQEFGLTYDIEKNTQDSLEFKAGGNTKLADDTKLDVKTWYGSYEMKTENPSTNPAYSYTNPGAAIASYISTRDHNPYYDFGGSAVVNRQLDGPVSEIMIGTDARNIFGKDDSLSYNSSNVKTAETITHGQQQSNGVFTQGSYRPESVPVDITLGLREDYWAAFGAQMNGNPQTAHGSYYHFDPRLGAKYSLADNFSVRGAVYENYAAPGMNQLFRSYGNASSYNKANGSLTPETNFGKELGIDYKWNTVSLSATVFHNDVTNFIDNAKICQSAGACVPFNPSGVTASTITQSNNAGSAVTEGWEVENTWEATPTVTVNNSLTRTVASLTDNGTLAAVVGQSSANSQEPLHQQLGNVPPLMFTSNVSWQATDQLRLTTQLRAWNQTPNDTQHTAFNSGAAVVDLGATYDLNERYQLFGSVTNLFDHSYYSTGPSLTSTGTPPVQGAPLTAFAGVRVNFE